MQPGYHVALTFNPPFDMEHHGACDYDFVEVSDSYLDLKLRNAKAADKIGFEGWR